MGSSASRSLAVALFGFIGLTPVHASELLDAVKAGDIARVQTALAGGADVNEVDFAYGSALHLATAIGNREIADALIAAGADLEATGEPAGAHPLHVAAQTNEAEIAALLVAKDAIVDATDSEGRTPLFVAAANGSLETAKVLLAGGADPNIKDTISGDGPLHIASYSGHEGVVELFLSKGVEVNSISGQGGTALHYAASASRLQIVELLLAKGADPNIRDAARRTPLQVTNSPAIAELLRSHGSTD